MLGLKLNHVSKRSHRGVLINVTCRRCSVWCRRLSHCLLYDGNYGKPLKEIIIEFDIKTVFFVFVFDHLICITYAVCIAIYLLYRLTWYDMVYINLIERNTFFAKIVQTYEEFTYLNDVEKFNFIMTNCNPQLLKWLGKFIHISFHKRNLNSASYRNWIYGVLHAYPGCGNQSRVLIYIPCWICHGCANRYALIMRILHLFIIQVH